MRLGELKIMNEELTKSTLEFKKLEFIITIETKCMRFSNTLTNTEKKTLLWKGLKTRKSRFSSLASRF